MCIKFVANHNQIHLLFPNFGNALFLILFFVCSNVCLAADNSYQLGFNLYNKKQYGPAASFFEVASKNGGPQTANARYLLGNCYTRLNRPNDAITQYRESYRLNPNGPQAKHCLNALKQLYSTSTNQAESPAQENSQQSEEPETQQPNDKLAVHKNKVDTLLKTAYSLEQKGSLRKSEQLYTEAIYQAEKLGSRSEHLLNALDATSGFYIGSRQYRKAAKIYDRQARVTAAMRGRNSPDVLNVKRALAQAYENAGQLGAAEVVYNECISGWSELYRSYETSHKPSLAGAKNSLAGAYSDMAGLLNQKNDFNGAERYTNLANGLR